MKKNKITILPFLTLVLLSFQILAQKKQNAHQWKFGVALYTFSNMSFPEQLAYADSAI